MHSDLSATLQATGYITFEQLHRHFERTASSIVLEPWMLMTSQGLWDRHQYRTGVHLHHWALRTEVYLYLAPHLMEWQIEAHAAQGIRPDALMYVSAVHAPIALEVDTGKETGRQWEEKLAAYELSPPNWHIFVVAQGKARRMRKLALLLSTACPRPWLLVPATDLADEWPWDWSKPCSSAPDAPNQASTERAVQYCLNGEVVAREWAESQIRAGHLQFGAQERRHGVDVFHLRG
jgi:hypothetical protein